MRIERAVAEQQQQRAEKLKFLKFIESVKKEEAGSV